MRRSDRFAAVYAAVLLLPSAATAQTDPAGGATAERAPAIQLPSDPRLWRNSPPLSMESLRGKGVVLYFFEEEHLRLAESWEGVQSLVASHRADPVLFVAVNSGTAPHEFERYVRRNHITVPVVYDPTRELESAAGVPQLSAEGTPMALAYVSGGGSLGVTPGAGPAAFNNAFKSAANGAAWRVAPAEVPPPLRGAWRQIELGDFASAARPVTRAAQQDAGPLKEAADKLLAAVAKEATDAAKAAAGAQESGGAWASYRASESLAQRFAGYDFPEVKAAEERVEALAKTEAIRNEIAAARMLDTAMSRGSLPNLKRVGAKYPDTEAARRAAEMLTKAAG